MRRLHDATDQIKDVDSRSPDAEFVLEPEDYDLRWVEQRVPPDRFKGPDGESLDVVMRRISNDAEQLAKIQDWIDRDHHGDSDAAIRERPLLAYEDGYLIDGWHRLLIWLRDRHRESGPVTLVGA